jgi:hypothetical protein
MSYILIIVKIPAATPSEKALGGASGPSVETSGRLTSGHGHVEMGCTYTMSRRLIARSLAAGGGG